MTRAKSEPASHNLPALLSSFIGREREIAEAKQFVATHRLVTLTGPGGCGKTRLAIRVASEMLVEFEDGVWLTEFAPLADAALVPQAVASTLGVREQAARTLTDTLTDYLQARQTLLVLDNCEHLVAACARLTETLLQTCTGLHILATSREPLGVPGEAVWIVPPMSLPDAQPWRDPAAAQAALPIYEQSEAVQLFVARAQAASPDFALTTDNGSWVAVVCRRLDGMPLAIELAAARVRALSVQQVAEHLDDRFHLLTGGSRTAPTRHQTLEATLEWSYALLSDMERTVLQGLSVFAGGWTLEAAQEVCTDEELDQGEVLDAITHLVDKSLVMVEKGGEEVRYRLLETIRQYAGAKLAEAGGIERVKDNHFIYYLHLTERAEPHLFSSEQLLWLNRFESEHGNLRAALEWSQMAEQRGEAGLRMAAIVGIFWQLHGYHGEGRTRLTAALAQEAAQKPTAARAKALHQASVLAFYQSDYAAVRALLEESLAIWRQQGPAGRLGVANALEMLAEVNSETGEFSTAVPLYEEALTLYREVGDLVGIADTLKMLGWSAMRTGDYGQAESRLEEALGLCRQVGDLRHISSALAGLGELALRRGQLERSSRLLQEGLDVTRKLGEKWGLAIVLGSLGWVALQQRDFIRMRALLGESLAVRLETGDRGGIAWCLEKLAQAASLRSQPQQAATVFGAAAAIRAPVASVIDPADQPEYERIVAGLRTSLGEEAFAAAWSEGEGMPLETVIDYALHEPGLTSAESARAEKEKFGGLTAREREVASLIAQGKSNREIAKAMTVGPKTVETYVTRILSKLGFESRVQIATWMLQKVFDEKEPK